MSTGHSLVTQAFLRLKQQVQEVFDFSVVVSYAVPALKIQIKLFDTGTLASLPKPDYYKLDMNESARLRSRVVNYKSQLAKYTLISIFSFFESFVKDIMQEMIDFHGGNKKFIERAGEYDRKFLSMNTADYEENKRSLRKFDKRKIQKYQKISRKLSELGYRFPLERFSRLGAERLIQMLNHYRAASIPDILRYGIHMQISDLDVEEFLRIKNIRNDIAHGKPVSLSVQEVAKINEFLRELAYRINNHIGNHYMIIDEYN